MHSFMAMFEEYVMVDVVEGEWCTFRKQLSTLQIFEEVVRAH